MSRKDIIVMSVLVNAGLIIILLVSSLTTKDSYFVASAKVAGTILETNENGMLPTLKPEDKSEIDKLATAVNSTKSSIPSADKGEISVAALEEPNQEIVHKLPEVTTAGENVEANDLPSVAAAVELPLDKPFEKRFMEITVRKGDTVEKIAKLNHTSSSEILKINELPNTFLKIGQTLLVPKVERTAKEGVVAKKNIGTEPNYYTVKCGDNPWTIAMKHHLKVDELLKMNNLNSTTAKKLRAGDKLRIK